MKRISADWVWVGGFVFRWRFLVPYIRPAKYVPLKMFVVVLFVLCLGVSVVDNYVLFSGGGALSVQFDRLAHFVRFSMQFWENEKN